MQGNKQTLKRMLKARLGKMLRLVSKPTNQTPEESTSEDCCQFQQLPDEMLIAIFKHLDRPVLFNARGVCSRWNKLTLRYMQNSFPVVQVSRLTVTYIEESNAYKLSWCKYTSGDNSCHELHVPMESLDQNYSLGFCFAQLDIQRLIIESIPKHAFTNKFVHFLCEQFRNCRDFKPVQLSIKNVDLEMLGTDALKQLLATCSKRLEILEFFALGNVAPIADEHLLILEHTRVRRLSIQFKESDEDSSPNNLKVTDTSLQAFTKLRVFPSFIMGRCVVTANAVCDYVKEWLLVVDEESSDMKSHTLTLHDCPYVSNEALEEECERQGLVAIKRTQDDQVNKFPFDIMANGGTHVNYAIRLNKPQQEFSISLFTTNNH